MVDQNLRRRNRAASPAVTPEPCDHRRVRGKNLAIGALAAAGFIAIVRLTGDREGGGPRPPAPSRPAAPAPAASPPAGPEATPGPDEISVLSLLDEMIDLGRLARLPAARFVAGQAASTDRRSRSPDDAAAWFANDDFVTPTQANLVRVEARPDGSKRYVLADVTGPGAIVRIWSATPTGTLRIHIDDEPAPALEAPMAALLRGDVAPFARPLAHVAARGYNLYFPFPFARRCVVTVDDIVSPDPFTGRPMAKLYYQIGYRRYTDAPAGLRPFSAAELTRAAPTIARVAAVLRDGPQPAAPPPGGQVVTIAETDVDPAHPSVTEVPAPPGGAAIMELRLQSAERAPAKLRSTRLSIAFDGETTVDAPLIDFFGTGPGWNTYSSLPFTVAAEDLLVCRFRMPFARRAVVTIARSAPGAVKVAGALVLARAPFGEDSLLFHARWRPREVLPTRPFRDWHVAGIKGRGHLVGAVLDVENPNGALWWGEGDEKIYVDGETFPGFFGTGTEDYFGYAWSSTERFEHAYHAQTAAGGNGFAGAYSMNRFHIFDPIPFARALRFDLEIWHWTEDTSIAVDATVYWYARPGAGAGDDFHSSTGSATRPAAR
jgi:hypothetical protein